MKLRYLLLIPVIIAFLLWGLAACTVNSLVYPGSTMHMPDAAYGHKDAAIAIKAADGTTLRGWFFNRGADSPLVAMYGGNAMNVGGFIDIALADPARSYLFINYRGYGDSEGQPDEKSIVADARHCITAARNKMGNNRAPLYLVGYSLGSSVATQVAASEHPEHLVLICPFDSITAVACGIVPILPHLLPMDSWRSADVAPGLTCPVTILRGEYDTIVPPESTDRLIRAFTTPPTVKSYPAGHNSIFTHPGFTEDIMKELHPNRI